MRTSVGVSLGVAAAASVAVACLAIARPTGYDLAVETVLRLRVAAAVLASEVPDGQALPEPHEAFVPLAALRERLDPKHRSLLGDAKDAWGRPLVYWSDGNRFLVLSYGADGLPEVDYAGAQPWTLVTAGTPGDPNADLVVVDGELWRGPGTTRDDLRRVMSSMRAVGTAIESYSVDFSHYPESFGFDHLQVLESTLEPVYIRTMPLNDPWERPLWVRSVADEAYWLVSYGADGQPEFPYTSWGPSDWNALPERATTEPGQDLIFTNGQFVRWPATLPR